MSAIPSLSSNNQIQIDPLTGKVSTPAKASTAAAASSGSSSTPSIGGTSSLANESTFLTLLVAQLKNQDPEQPADGTQFVTQLAQFTTLEQNLAMRQDLDSINKKTQVAATTPVTSGTNPSATQAA